MTAPPEPRRGIHGRALVAGVVSAATLCVCSGRGHFGRTAEMAPAAVPRVFVPEPVRDLGPVPHEGPLSVRFPVRNVGRRRLVINERDPACGCTGSSRRTYVVAPGDTVELTVVLAARPDDGGLVAVSEFSTNDPSRPLVRLVVRGRALRSADSAER